MTFRVRRAKGVHKPSDSVTSGTNTPPFCSTTLLCFSSFCISASSPGASSQRGLVDVAGLKWIGDGKIKEGGEAIGKVRVHNVTRAALCVPTNPLLSLSVWVIEVQRLPNDVSEGIVATDPERTKEDKKLIEAVRSFPCLWNVNSRAYKDARAKENAWREVAKVSMLFRRHYTG